MTELYIKNMVCNRCIMAIRQELSAQGIEPLAVELGMVRLREAVDKNQMAEIGISLKALGFELLDGAKSRLVERIKKLIIQKIHHSEYVDIKENWSGILADELHHEYKYLSTLFSSVEGITVEQYIIRQKIEKVKELLFYDELNLNEISYRLGYSSVQHLSAQFKKITGQTPSGFKGARSNGQSRSPIDHV